MVEIAQALEQVHVETSASGGFAFYSDNDGNPIRDWGDLFRRLRAGAQAPAGALWRRRTRRRRRQRHGSGPRRNRPSVPC